MSGAEDSQFPSRVFIGREPEIAELRAGVDAALSGLGRLFLISGEPGIGKTSVAEEISVYARKRGVQVIWGRSGTSWIWKAVSRNTTASSHFSAVEEHSRWPPSGATARVSKTNSRWSDPSRRFRQTTDPNSATPSPTRSWIRVRHRPRVGRRATAGNGKGEAKAASALAMDLSTLRVRSLFVWP
jgi:AAA ATPase domain